MEYGTVEKAHEIPSRKKSLREKKRFQKSIWGSLFLEILLIKIWEKELREVKIEKAGETVFDGSRTEEEVPKKLRLETTGVVSPKERHNPWKYMDCLEITFASLDIPALCANYNDIIKALKYASGFYYHQMFRESYESMKEYYEGKIGRREVEEALREYCSSFLSIAENTQVLKSGLPGVLRDAYECFTRANTRNAVVQNNREGKMLVEQCGLDWSGTTYYNSYYYKVCKQVQKLFQDICQELSEEYGVAEIDFEEIEKSKKFSLDGGFSYHGVWVWKQKQNNYPCGQYGLRDEALEPPENFIFLYRNCYEQAEENRVGQLQEKLLELVSQKAAKEQKLKIYTVSGGSEYHNGMSYLLDDDKTWEQDGMTGQDIRSFLMNFKLFRVSGCMEILYGRRDEKTCAV